MSLTPLRGPANYSLAQRHRYCETNGRLARNSKQVIGARTLVRIDFRNTTHLSSDKLLALVTRYSYGWRIGGVVVRIRYTKSAAYSGTCFYKDRRIYVNIGRKLRYPFRMATHLARARSSGRTWCRPAYFLTLRDGHELALFIFLHELYHLLVKVAKRNTRQKESMCDRFAAAVLVDDFGAVVTNGRGNLVDRREWHFQNLTGFVEAARDRRVRTPTSPEPVSTKTGREDFERFGSPSAAPAGAGIPLGASGPQLILFS